MKIQVVMLEDRIENNDLYEWRDTLVVSGFCVSVHLSNERTLKWQPCSWKINLIWKLAPPSSLNDIDWSQKALANAQRSPIIMKLRRKNFKTDMLKSASISKPDSWKSLHQRTSYSYAEHHLLCSQKAKKYFPNIISDSKTLDGKNFVWIKAPNHETHGARNVRKQVFHSQRPGTVLLSHIDIKQIPQPLR